MKDVKIFAKTVEQEAIDQVNVLSETGIFDNKKIRIMPDTHAGKGCVIGFTAEVGDKIIPSLIGVDISCGMLVSQLSEAPKTKFLQETIEKNVPFGRNIHESNYFGGNVPESFKERYKYIKSRIRELSCYRYLKDAQKFSYALGSLGSGNHFIELNYSEKQDAYFLVIHTGSRNLGKQVADYYQSLAAKMLSGWDKVMEEQKKLIETYKAQGRKTEIQEAISELHRNFKAQKPDLPKDLCYLEGEEMQNYLHDTKICQEFANMNREMIRDEILLGFPKIEVLSSFCTLHNYLGDDGIMRKGAISCREGERVIIPMNMRDGSLICIGKGNSDWNFSGPHGAGRLMSRTKAKQTLTMQEFQEAMSGIDTWSLNENTLDEAPQAYKPMEEIIELIKDTVEIVDIIKPVYNFKANE